MTTPEIKAPQPEVRFDAFDANTLCANCGARWGQHFGDMCHEEGPGTFAPAPSAAIPAPEGADLPPLPEPAFADQHAYVTAFSADQMRDYARAALAAQPQPTRSQRLADAGYTRRPSWKSLPKDGDEEGATFHGRTGIAAGLPAPAEGASAYRVVSKAGRRYVVDGAPSDADRSQISDMGDSIELLYGHPQPKGTGAEPDNDICPNCQGSGEITVMTGHLGPDDYEYPATCDHCKGNGDLESAYLGVVKLMEMERASKLKLSGKLYGLRHFTDAREAFLLEVGEDLARWKDPVGYWKDKTARAAARFDADGFRAWVLANLPDETVIGSSAWWANHLTEWAGRFVKSQAPAVGEQPQEVQHAAWRNWADAGTVGSLIAFLATLDQAAPIVTAYHVTMGNGERRCKTHSLTISRERVDHTARTIRTADKSLPYTHVLWAQPPEPAPLTPEQIEATVDSLWSSQGLWTPLSEGSAVKFTRAIEQAHGIGSHVPVQPAGERP